MVRALRALENHRVSPPPLFTDEKTNLVARELSLGK